jgi:hypothetical protein
VARRYQRGGARTRDLEAAPIELIEKVRDPGGILRSCRHFIVASDGVETFGEDGAPLAVWIYSQFALRRAADGAGVFGTPFDRI